MKGLNTLLDPSDIDDDEMADCQNIVFDNGMITPRKGSNIFASKPPYFVSPFL
jgi:hypothetical protein